ncbi:HD domain-containing protein, partial [candidate division FCPU426 bacterium]|nr:HD domain-containing protein [candidate division FCPU426 bacterium]
LRIAALLTQAASSLAYISRQPGAQDQGLTRAQESRMKREADLAAVKYFYLILNRAISEFLVTGSVKGGSDWFIRGLNNHVPRRIKNILRHPSLERVGRIAYGGVLHRSLRVLQDRFNRWLFRRLDLQGLYGQLALLKETLDNRTGVRPELFQRQLLETRQRLIHLLALVSGCLYLRTRQEERLWGYGDERRTIIMEQIDIVGLSQLVTHLEDIIHGQAQPDSLDYSQLRERVGLFQHLFRNVLEYAREKVADTSHQTPYRWGVFCNHGEKQDFSQAGLYAKLEQDLKAGKDRVHFIWAMGGGADVLSGVKRRRELDSFYQEIRAEQTARKQPCGNLRIVLLTSAEKRIGYVNPSENPAAWRGEQNPLYLLEEDSLNDPGRGDLSFQRRQAGVIAPEDIVGTASRFKNIILQATSWTKVRGAGRKLDEAYLVEELTRAGENAEIYLVALTESVGKTAGHLADFMRSGLDSPADTMSLELYEHGGDAIALMHAGDKEAIVSPTNEKFATQVARHLGDLLPGTDCFFTLSGLGNDFESYHKWINEVLRYLLKEGAVAEIVAPWAAGVSEGASLAESVSGQVYSFANKRGLKQITGKSLSNTCYRLLRALGRSAFWRRLIESWWRFFFSTDKPSRRRNLFRSVFGYSREGKVRRRGDFHGSLSFEQKGEIAKFSFILPFKPFARLSDRREQETIYRICTSPFSHYKADEIKRYQSALSIEESAERQGIKRLDVIYRRLGITTESGTVSLAGFPEKISMPKSRLAEPAQERAGSRPDSLRRAPLPSWVQEILFRVLPMLLFHIGYAGPVLSGIALAAISLVWLVSHRKQGWTARQWFIAGLMTTIIALVYFSTSYGMSAAHHPIQGGLLAFIFATLLHSVNNWVARAFPEWKWPELKEDKPLFLENLGQRWRRYWFKLTNQGNPLQVFVDFNETVTKPRMPSSLGLKDIISQDIRGSALREKFREDYDQAQDAFEHELTAQAYSHYHHVLKDHMHIRHAQAQADSWEINPNFIEHLRRIQADTGMREIELTVVSRSSAQALERFFAREDVKQELAGLSVKVAAVLANRMVFDEQTGYFTGAVIEDYAQPLIADNKYIFVPSHALFLGDAKDQHYAYRYFIDVNQVDGSRRVLADWMRSVTRMRLTQPLRYIFTTMWKKSSLALKNRWEKARDYRNSRAYLNIEKVVDKIPAARQVELLERFEAIFEQCQVEEDDLETEEEVDANWSEKIRQKADRAATAIRKEVMRIKRSDLQGLSPELQEAFWNWLLLTLYFRHDEGYTFGHVWDVGQLAAEMAAVRGKVGPKKNLTMEIIELYRRAGWHHDAGKLLLPKEILLKGTLSPKQHALARSHARLSEILLQAFGFGPEIIQGTNHHEWINGEGYPRGLHGDSIPELSRALTVADAYDASSRRYTSEAEEEIERQLQDFSTSEQPRYDHHWVKALQYVITRKHLGDEDLHVFELSKEDPYDALILFLKNLGPNSLFYWLARVLFPEDAARQQRWGRRGLLLEIPVLIILGVILSPASLLGFFVIFALLHQALAAVAFIRSKKKITPAVLWSGTKQLVLRFLVFMPYVAIPVAAMLLSGTVWLPVLVLYCGVMAGYLHYMFDQRVFRQHLRELALQGRTAWPQLLALSETLWPQKVREVLQAMAVCYNRDDRLSLRQKQQIVSRLHEIKVLWRLGSIERQADHLLTRLADDRVRLVPDRAYLSMLVWNKWANQRLKGNPLLRTLFNWFLVQIAVLAGGTAGLDVLLELADSRNPLTVRHACMGLFRLLQQDQELPRQDFIASLQALNQRRLRLVSRAQIRAWLDELNSTPAADLMAGESRALDPHKQQAADRLLKEIFPARLEIKQSTPVQDQGLRERILENAGILGIEEPLLRVLNGRINSKNFMQINRILAHYGYFLNVRPRIQADPGSGRINVAFTLFKLQILEKTEPEVIRGQPLRVFTLRLIGREAIAQRTSEALYIPELQTIGVLQDRLEENVARVQACLQAGEGVLDTDLNRSTRAVPALYEYSIRKNGSLALANRLIRKAFAGQSAENIGAALAQSYYLHERRHFISYQLGMDFHTGLGAYFDEFDTYASSFVEKTSADAYYDLGMVYATAHKYSETALFLLALHDLHQTGSWEWREDYTDEEVDQAFRALGEFAESSADNLAQLQDLGAVVLERVLGGAYRAKGCAQLLPRADRILALASEQAGRSNDDTTPGRGIGAGVMNWLGSPNRFWQRWFVQQSGVRQRTGLTTEEQGPVQREDAAAAGLEKTASPRSLLPAGTRAGQTLRPELSWPQRLAVHGLQALLFLADFRWAGQARLRLPIEGMAAFLRAALLLVLAPLAWWLNRKPMDSRRLSETEVAELLRQAQ